MALSQITGSIEAEIADGLEAIAGQEIKQALSKYTHQNQFTIERGAVRFEYAGPLDNLLALRSVVSVYLILHFDVPRPRGLLGHQHFHALLRGIATVRQQSKEPFSSFFISAAGSESSVMSRIKATLAENIGLPATDNTGDLLIRIRPGRGGWEVLIRLTPRPLATRQWRVCNMEGALNAPTAYAMIMLLNPRHNEVFLNLGCGSGTLLIERAFADKGGLIWGCDHNSDALACARINIHAGECTDRIQLLQADMRSLPFPDQSVDSLCVDLPFGQLVGTHQTNVELYPDVLVEAARVAKQGARFAIITHEVRLTERLLNQNKMWVVEENIQIALRGLHPHIYLLRKA